MKFIYFFLIMIFSFAGTNSFDVDSLKKEFKKFSSENRLENGISDTSRQFARINLGFFYLIHPDSRGRRNDSLWLFGDRKHFIEEVEGMSLSVFFLGRQDSREMEDSLESLYAIEQSQYLKGKEKDLKMNQVLQKIRQGAESFALQKGFQILFYENISPAGSMDSLRSTLIWSENLEDLTDLYLPVFCEKEKIPRENCLSFEKLYRDLQ